MDAPRFLESLSPEEIGSLVDALPPDTLSDGLSRRQAETGSSLELEKSFLKLCSPDMLVAELIQRGELPDSLAQFITRLEADIETEEELSEEEHKRLVVVSQTCFDGVKKLLERAALLRATVFYNATVNGPMTRRGLSTLIDRAPARVQQIVDDKRKQLTD